MSSSSADKDKDKRFDTSAAQFKQQSKHAQKTEIDSRFETLLKDDKFTHTHAQVDKRGKPIRKEAVKPALSVRTKPEDRLDYLTKLARGEIENSSSSDEDDNDEENDSDSENSDSNDEDDDDESSQSSDDDQRVNQLGPLEVESKDSIPRGPAEETTTRRIAIVNIDWDHLRAIDIMMVLQSFNKGVESVVVYVSDFGKEQQQHEQVHGVTGIWANNSAEDNDEDLDINDEVEDEEEDGEENENGDFVRRPGHVGIVLHDELINNHKKKSSKYNNKKEKNSKKHGNKKSNVDDDDEKNVVDGVDMVALRRYELNRLRYFFAVVTTEDLASADALYNAVDGLELEHSATVFDLRFIPDDVSFEGREIRDECDRETIRLSLLTYDAPNFVTKSLQHSKVECSWDADDKRDRILNSNNVMSKWKELNESDLRQYIASDNSDDEDEEDEEDDDDNDDNKVKTNKAKTATTKSKTEITSNDDRIEAPRTSKGKSRAATLRKLLLGDIGIDDNSEDNDDGENDSDDDDSDDQPIDERYAADLDEPDMSMSDDDEEEDGEDGEDDEGSLNDYIDDGGVASDDDDDDADGNNEEDGNKSGNFFMNDNDDGDNNNNNSNSNKLSKKSKKNKKVAENLLDKEMSMTYVPEGDDDQNLDDMTPFEALKMKLSEKRRARKLAKKMREEEEMKAKLEMKKENKHKKHRRNNDDDNDNDGDADYNMQSLIKEEKLKQKLKPGKKNKKILKELQKVASKNDQGDFKVDLNDDRFAAVVQGDSRFGIDRTSSLFKATAGMNAILEAQRQRFTVEDDLKPPPEKPYSKPTNKSIATIENAATTTSSSSSNSALELAKKLKRKFGNK